MRRAILGLLLLALALWRPPTLASDDPMLPPSPEQKMTVSELVRALEDPDKEVRVSATWELCDRGPLPPEAVAALTEMLKSRLWWGERSAACEALAASGMDFGPLLVQMAAVGNRSGSTGLWDYAPRYCTEREVAPFLRHEDPWVRLNVACIYPDLASDIGPAVTCLVDALAHPDPRVRAEASWNLGALGRSGRRSEARAAVPELRRLLRSPQDHDDAFRALSAIEPALPEVLRRLLGRLHRDGGSELDVGLRALSEQRSLLPSLVPRLVAEGARIDPDGHDGRQLTRREIAWSLGDLAPEDAHLLIAECSSDSFSARMLVLEALGLVAMNVRDEGNDEAPTEVRTVLVRGLEDPDPRCRALAAEGVGYLGAASGVAVERLWTLLEDESRQVADAASKALDELGGAAPPALPLALKAARSTKPTARAASASVLGEPSCATEESLARLRALLCDRDALVREHAAIAAGGLGEGAGTVVDSLMARLGDPSPYARAACAESLGRLGAKKAVPRLARTLRDAAHERHGFVQRSVASALCALAGPDARPYLLPMLSSEDRESVAASAAALVDLGDRTDAVITALESALPLVEAAAALGRAGDPARRTAPSLRECVRPWDGSHAGAAAAAALYVLGDRSRRVTYVLRGYLGPPTWSWDSSFRRAAYGWMLDAPNVVHAGLRSPEMSKYLARIVASRETFRREQRCEAIDLLAQIGYVDDAVTAALRQALAHRDPRVQEAAAKALDELRPRAG